MAKKTYVVVFPVKSDGKRYKRDETIQLEPEQAEQLLDRGVIKNQKGEAKDPNPGMPDPQIGEPKAPEGKAKILTDDPGTQAAAQ